MTGAGTDANLRTWADPSTVDVLRVEGWSDPGEIVAMSAFADLVRDRPVLDLGVGTGRTTPLLRMTTSSYVALDYSPEMVDVARRRYPDEDIRSGDARTLSDFAGGSFRGVVFSFNGIDAVGHDDRAAVLDAVRRVLEPGGLFLYSTLHRDGPAYRQRPWRRQALPWVVGSLGSSHRPLPLRVAASLMRSVVDPGRLLRAARNWRRLAAQRVAGDDWAIAPTDAHEFGLLVHYTTVAGELRRLTTSGFEVVQTFAAEDGAPVHTGTPRRDVRWFHVLARRMP
jgi:SAM-dependent methyltransferase